MKLKKENEKKQKELEAKREYTKRMEEENIKTKEAEDLIAMLEKEELELIQRLKKTQEIQEMAYKSLQQSILTDKPVDI